MKSLRLYLFAPSVWLLLAACTQTHFDSIPTAPVTAPTSNAAPPATSSDSSAPKLVDLTIRANMNRPIDFSALLQSDPGLANRYLALSSDGAGQVKTAHGTLAIVDAANLSVRYTPDPDFRGNDTITVYLIQKNGQTVTAQITIEVDNALLNLKPAVAVRATGCIMCHATISSNVITDFGYGDPYFWGGAGSGVTGLTNIYADDAADPSWLRVDGLGPNVIVPQASTASLTKVGAPTLAAYIKTVLGVSTQPTVKAANVMEVQSVYIGAPTATRIVQAGNLKGGQVFAYLPDVGEPAKAPALIHQTAGGVDYWTNDPAQPLVCSGDVVIDGVLNLVTPVIQSDSGCRFYVTKSVFMTGPVTYQGGDPNNHNLQIVSARSINLGLGKNTCSAAEINGNSLTHRLKEEPRRQYFFTRGEPEKTVQQKLDDIYNDANQIGIDNFLDAACEPTHGRAVAFDRLILNAPIVFSRYQGNFSGSIIAEIALMSLNDFIFQFDPVFSSQVVLPLLEPSDFLSVKQ